MEFYVPGRKMMRCQACAAIVLDGDTELHSTWHEVLEANRVLLSALLDAIEHVEPPKYGYLEGT